MGELLSAAASVDEWHRLKEERWQEKEDRSREQEKWRRAKEETRARQSKAGGPGVKAQQGEVMVLEGGDGDGEGDEDVEGDEVQVHPNPLYYHFPRGCKRPSGKTQRSTARQPLPPGLPKCWRRAVGQTNQFVLTQARLISPCAGSNTDFSVAYLGKMVRARGSVGGYVAKGGAGHGQPLPGGPMTPLPERISSGSLGGLNLRADPPGGQVWHRPLPGVPIALGSPWMV